MSPAQASKVLRLLTGYTVVSADTASVPRAFELQQRHRVSVWDALIVKAAIDARCRVLYSEDLQSGMRLDAPGAPAVEVVNPFKPGATPAVHELAGRYRVAASTEPSTKPRPRRAGKAAR
jgi:predicted nucleic acid-binding protein